MKIRSLILILVIVTVWMFTNTFLKSFFWQKDIFKSCDLSENTTSCRESYVISILEKMGATQAFLAIENLKKNDSEFGPVCHAFAHTIGVAAYPLILKNVDVFSHPISTCELGYIHGLMMEIIMHKNDFAFARSYCERLRPKGKLADFSNVEQCYHGVGHGLPLYTAINKPHVSKTVSKSDVFEIIKTSLKMCDDYFNGEWECRRGVYGGVASFFMGDHGFIQENISIRDIFDICVSQSESLKKSCYEMLSPALTFLTKQDVDKAVMYSKKYIKSNEELVYIAQPLGSFIITSSNEVDGLADVLVLCRSFEYSKAILICIEGYASSIVDAWKIDDFNKDILSVCDRQLLTDEEYRHCRIGALGQAKSAISAKEFRILCQSLTDIERKSFCKN